jgi:hypothetical protein
LALSWAVYGTDLELKVVFIKEIGFRPLSSSVAKRAYLHSRRTTYLQMLAPLRRPFGVALHSRLLLERIAQHRVQAANF